MIKHRVLIREESKDINFYSSVKLNINDVIILKNEIFFLKGKTLGKNSFIGISVNKIINVFS
jgi:hypothetical protein